MELSLYSKGNPQYNDNRPLYTLDKPMTSQSIKSDDTDTYVEITNVIERIMTFQRTSQSETLFVSRSPRYKSKDNELLH